MGERAGGNNHSLSQPTASLAISLQLVGEFPHVNAISFDTSRPPHPHRRECPFSLRRFLSLVSLVPQHPIKQLDRVNLDDIWQWHVEQKEIKKALTREQKAVRRGSLRIRGRGGVTP